MPRTSKSSGAGKRDAVATRKFAKGLKTLPDNYVLCRDLKHSWDVQQDYHAVPYTYEGRPVQAMRRVLACKRCPCTRTQHFIVGRTRFEKVGDTYWRPPDYTVAGVPRGVPVQVVVQQETYRRAMERATNVPRGTRAAAER